MSRSDHNRSRSTRGYTALKRQRTHDTRHLARFDQFHQPGAGNRDGMLAIALHQQMKFFKP